MRLAVLVVQQVVVVPAVISKAPSWS